MRFTDIQAEVLIAGAGPAGASTSLFLSKHKIHHIILDKAVFPRDKICGDALSGKVVHVLNKLDPSYIPELESKKEFLGSYGVQFVAPNGKTLDIPFSQNIASLKHAPGFISRRTDFDDFLFRKLDPSYATILENTAILDLDYTPSGIRVLLDNHGEKLQVESKIIVGAEGDRSIVAKKFADFQKENKHYCAGLRAYYKGVEGLHAQNFIELHFLPDFLPGYLWIFPMPDGMANVGVGMLSEVVSRKHVNLKSEMEKALQTIPALKHRFRNAEKTSELKGWGLPLGSKKRKISGDNFLLVGDAASLIDPFTGEGIGNAMLSGMIAAEKIISAVRIQQFDALSLASYDEQVYHALWSELNLSHTLQKLTNQAWLFNFVVNKASKSKTLRETITCMFEDLDMRSRLRNPLFYLKLLLNK